MALDSKISIGPVTADPLRDVRSQNRVDANDFKRFAALRSEARADDPKALRAVARQFESIFTKMMLDSARKASFGDSLFGSDQGDMYQDMMDDQLSVEMSQGKGLGLADMLIRQLSHGENVTTAPTGPAKPLDLETPGANKELPLDDATKQKFIEKMRPQAEAAARELGVEPRAILAQAALETGWGRSLPADASNNFFGIKANPAWRGAAVAADTQEYSGGVARAENASFRSYGSVRQGVDDYVSFLRDNPRYSEALGAGSDVRAFANALQRAGYATDPDYANKLVAIAEQLSSQAASRQPVAASADANLKAQDAAPITRLES
jgi:flagellar protein FlgJ